MASEQPSNHCSRLPKSRQKLSSESDNKSKNQLTCCNSKHCASGVATKELKKSLPAKLEKQESYCVLKQKKPESPKNQAKDTEKPTVASVINNNEELSRAKKRRLRKKKILATYTNNKVEEPTVGSVKPEQVVSHPSPVSRDVNKTVTKELRKRTDKTIQETRKKKINAKSPPDCHPLLRKDTDSCCIKVNNDCQKIVEPTIPKFYFPVNSASSNGRSNSGNNGVFYFGETKSELSAFKSFSPLINTNDVSKKENISFNFSPVKVKPESIPGFKKYQPEDNLLINPPRVFPSPKSTERNYDFIDSSRTIDLNKTQHINTLHNLPISFGNCIPNNSFNQVLPSVSTVPEPKPNMNPSDTQQSTKGGKSREEVLAEREAKKAAKLAAKNKHKDKTLNVDSTNINNPSKTTVDSSSKPRTTVDSSSKPRTTVDSSSKPRTTVDSSSNTRTTVDSSSKPRTIVDNSSNARTTVDSSSKPRTTVDSSSNTRTTVDSSSKPRTTVDNSSNARTTVDSSSKPSTTVDSPLQLKEKPINVESTNTDKDPKSRTAVDGSPKPTKPVIEGQRSVDCVDGALLLHKHHMKEYFSPESVLHVLKGESELHSSVDTYKKDNGNQEPLKAIKTIENVLLQPVLDSKGNDKLIESKKEKESIESGKSKAELRAERRAKQEAQRAAKASAKQEVIKKAPQVKEVKPKVELQVEKKEVVSDVKPSTRHKAKLFSHLYKVKRTNSVLFQTLNTDGIHPAIVRLGCQYASRVVNGSNARCIALLNAIKQVICDYTTPSKKEFSRGLEGLLTPITDYLNSCRPLSVSMINALRHIKWHLTQLPNDVSDEEAQKKLCDIIDTYIREQIDVAGEAICNTVQKKIANDDVILTYGCSSLIYRILVESHRSGTKFRVVVVDGGPWKEGREMLRRLVENKIECSYVLITATSFIMREVSKVLLGAHALLANGYVMSRAGSSQVALLAHSFNVPVLVCCETHKFSERVQTDAFVYNELGDPEEFVPKDKWANYTNLTPLTLVYDVTPPELVTAVVTELGILPCTSVPVILRIKPSESLM